MASSFCFAGKGRGGPSQKGLRYCAANIYWISILQLNEQHKKVFSEAPRVTFRRAKNLNDNLVRASLPKSKQISSQVAVERKGETNFFTKS